MAKKTSAGTKRKLAASPQKKSVEIGRPTERPIKKAKISSVKNAQDEEFKKDEEPFVKPIEENVGDKPDEIEAEAKKEEKEEVVENDEDLPKSLRKRKNPEKPGKKKNGKKDSAAEEKGPADPGPKSSVLRLLHIPFGFFEKQLDGYFTQFGKVLKIRVLRNRKGHHNGVAFVEFENKKVAAIAAQTMDGYLLAEKRLRCKVLGENEIPKCISNFTSRYGKIVKPYETRRKYAENFATERTPLQEKRQMKRFVEGLRKKQKKIAALGIDYDCSFIFAKLEAHRNAELAEAKAKHDKLVEDMKAAAAQQNNDNKKEEGEKANEKED